ncbi:MAG: phosphoesterase [Clostridia bacterium]|nr:phosphoesterase [Clostridia bacterium]
MTRFACDLHIHSCLSPCADDDMTPYGIAGMAKLNGLGLIALTDHNSSGNARVFLDACAHYGLIGVPGMELTTAEEIHAVCLFPDMDAASAWEAVVRGRRPQVKNRPEVFGRQILAGADDEPVGEEQQLLIYATSLSLEEAAERVRALGGAFYPAHIDREANGILGVLGALPETPAFPTLELHGGAAYGGRRVLRASDAHRLWEIAEDGFPIELAASPEDPAAVRRALIDWLEGR